MIEINNFPLDIDDEDITEFIIDFGLSYYHRNYYNIDINSK